MPSLSRLRARPRRASARRMGAALLAMMAAGLVTLLAPTPVHAQSDFFSFLRPPAAVPQAPRNRGNTWWAPFQQPAPQPPAAVQQAPRKREPPPEPEGVVYASADTAVQGKRQPPSQFVLVLGDRIAGQLAQGLADSYVPDRARVAIIENSVDESGFLPAPVDWIARAPAAVAAARPTVAVLALGSDDLAPIKDGETAFEPLTERWVELYARRVDDVLAQLRDRAGRVIVVGLAPVANASLSEDYGRLNEVLRARAARAGLPFVNVWDGFVDEDGKYLATGPAVDGQRRRLRTNDGVRFTRAGGRKLAFFVQKDLNRLLEEPAKPAGPAEGSGARALSLAGGPAAARVGDGASPVNASASGQGSARLLQEGVSPSPVRGRADDFTWPPPWAADTPAPQR